MKGQIRKMFPDKGYGFIRGQNGKEYFFYYSSIGKKMFSSMTVGQQVVFDIGRADKGEERATEIKMEGH